MAPAPSAAWEAADALKRWVVPQATTCRPPPALLVATSKTSGRLAAKVSPAARPSR